jgi:predicted Zn-dependent protease
VVTSTTTRPTPRTLVGLAVVALLLAAPPPLAAEATDHERELARIDEALADLEEGAPAAPRLLVLRAALTGEFADYQAAERALDGVLKWCEGCIELLFLRADLYLKLHRPEAAGAVLDRILGDGGDPADPRMLTLRADAALQEGRIAAARAGYRNALATRSSWDLLARLAYLEANTGDVAAAERLYLEAQDLLTAKEMRSYAWLELQRGVLDLERKEPAAALVHYRHAERAYSGYPLIEEHLAEALALLGHHEEAAARYRDLTTRTRNPEIVGALARLVAPTDPVAAAALDAEAWKLFEERRALYPEAALGHFVEHALARGGTPGPELIQLAEQNYRLRPNPSAKLLLARACLETGEAARARTLVDEVLATPWRSPELARLSARLQ